MTAAELIEKWKDAPTIETHTEMGCTGLACSRCAATKLARMCNALVKGSVCMEKQCGPHDDTCSDLFEDAKDYCYNCQALAKCEKIAGGAEHG